MPAGPRQSDGAIKGFSCLAQLYKVDHHLGALIAWGQDIAACFDDVSEEDVLFCTMNTHRLDMNCLVSMGIDTHAFVFAHIAGQHKEVELVKPEGYSVDDI